MRSPPAILRNLALAAAALLMMAAAPAPEPVRYRLDPVLADGALTALAVEVRLRGGDDGETLIDLPGKGADGTERWRLLSDLAAEGATLARKGDAQLVLTHAPGAPIVLRYRVRSAYPPEPPDENPPLKGPMLRRDWFMAPGFIFATPHDRDGDPATFAWGAMPEGWKAEANLDHGALGQPMTVQDVFDGILIGGRGLTELTRRIPGSTLRVAVLPADWSLPPDRIADTLAQVIVAQRRFWNDLDTPFFVAVTPMAPSKGRGSVGGFGRWQGFALFASVNSERAIFQGNIAHEHTHTWIPRRIGTAPHGRAQVGQFWLSEGFTDFLGDRALLRQGVWTPQAHAASFNRALARYATPETRNLTNAQIVERAFSSLPNTLAPYDRGRLLAAIWDRQIVRATNGRRSLDDVVFAMRDRYLAAPEHAKPGTVENFVRTYKELSGGLDVSDDIARYVTRGETIVLPRLLYAPCRIVMVTEEGRTFQRIVRPPDADWAACGPRLAGVPFLRR